MDSGTDEERSEGKEGQVKVQLNFGKVDTTVRPFSYTERLKQACIKNVEYAVNDELFFAKWKDHYERESERSNKLGEQSHTELKKQFFYLQAELFDLRSLLSGLTEAMLSENERLWRMNVFVLEAIKLDVLHSTDETKKQFLQKVEELQSRYDTSHNGIMAYLQRVKETNPWFKEVRGEEKKN